MPGVETWVENTPGIRAFEESDPGLNAHLKELAEKARNYARSIAPVGSPADGDEHPGQYRDSIDVEKIDDGPGWRLFASDNKAHWIEYGNAHGMPRYQVLTRAVEQIQGG